MTSVNKMELFEENPSNPMRKNRRSFFEIFKNVVPYINIMYWGPMYQWKVDLFDDFMAGLIIAIISLTFYRIFQSLWFNQVRIFKKIGGEIELIYQQHWFNINSSNSKNLYETSNK